MFGLLWCQESGLQEMLNTLLEQNTDYQQSLSNWEQEKSANRIDKSLNWFDVNFVYRKYDNDFIRDETKSVLEHSKVDETDKRWRIEVEKQLFPKDFDNTADAINTRLNLIRYDQEIKLNRHSCISDIFDDMISWYEAEQMVELLRGRLQYLYDQNLLLEELDQENLVDPGMMIDVLEEIDDKEDELYDFLEVTSLMKNKYEDIFTEFISNFELYVQEQAQPDTITFVDQVKTNLDQMKRDFQKLANKIKWSYINIYLPEVNLTFSYNWRENRQDWDIKKNNALSTMTRDQDEEFPEGEIELSLPFNIYSNTSGKLALLKSFERELHFRHQEIQLTWQNFELKRLSFYREAALEVKRKTRLHELYQRQLDLLNAQYQEEPTILGGNPELRLSRENMKVETAEMKMKIAEMKLYREIFLINNFGEEKK
jgi:hypothetical protein